jgi:hypothetical protein
LSFESLYQVLILFFNIKNFNKHFWLTIGNPTGDS